MHINLIGLEVEGGWNGIVRVAPFKDADIIPDHSIDGRTLPTDRLLKTTHVGEIVSAPMEPTHENISKWIETYWPDDSNQTCGYHIHLSFHKIKYYSLLTTKTFLYLLRKGMWKLGEELELPKDNYLWPRLSGHNPFATINFDASRQLQLRRKAVGDRLRYGFINCCWGIHKTIEFRALPTFSSKDTAKIFTFGYLTLVEAYLDKMKDVNFSFSSSLVDDHGAIIQHVK